MTETSESPGAILFHLAEVLEELGYGPANKLWLIISMYRHLSDGQWRKLFLGRWVQRLRWRISCREAVFRLSSLRKNGFLSIGVVDLTFVFWKPLPSQALGVARGFKALNLSSRDAASTPS